MAAKVMKCDSCRQHDFQDTKYGKNMRVHNGGGSKESPKWNCTVCSNVKSTSSDKK
jgi:hypothetical protein